MEGLCINCRSAKVEGDCGLCGEPVCKTCRVFLPEGSFAVDRKPLPDDLQHAYYCSTCYNNVVEPYKENYEATLEKAKRVNIIFKNSKSNVRVLKKALRTIEIDGAPDRDGAILALAFMAVQAGFSTLLNVEVAGKKVRNEGWQNMTWEAEGMPADIKSHQSDLDVVLNETEYSDEK